MGYTVLRPKSDDWEQKSGAAGINSYTCYEQARALSMINQSVGQSALPREGYVQYRSTYATDTANYPSAMFPSPVTDKEHATYSFLVLYS